MDGRLLAERINGPFLYEHRSGQRYWKKALSHSNPRTDPALARYLCVR
jgi:hypothetical protein